MEEEESDCSLGDGEAKRRMTGKLVGLGCVPAGELCRSIDCGQANSMGAIPSSARNFSGVLTRWLSEGVNVKAQETVEAVWVVASQQ